MNPIIFESTYLLIGFIIIIIAYIMAAKDDKTKLNEFPFWIVIFILLTWPIWTVQAAFSKGEDSDGDNS